MKLCGAAVALYLFLHLVSSHPGLRTTGVVEFRDSQGNAMLKRMVDDKEVAKRCKCSCRRKDSNDWYCCECGWTGGCFPAVAKVTLSTGDIINMADLKTNDIVLTVDEHGEVKHTKVQAMLERYPDGIGKYLNIMTSSNHMISLTGTHQVYSSSSNDSSTMEARFADSVEVGDYVMVHAGSDVTIAAVTQISQEAFKGIYNPLTEDGTILVDGILASCYASYDHQMAHLALTPLRWMPWMFNYAPNEEGTHPYVRFLKLAAGWLLPRCLKHDQDKNGLSAQAEEQSTINVYRWFLEPLVTGS